MLATKAKKTKKTKKKIMLAKKTKNKSKNSGPHGHPKMPIPQYQGNRNAVVRSQLQNDKERPCSLCKIKGMHNLTGSLCLPFARFSLCHPPMYCHTARWHTSTGTLMSCFEAVHWSQPESEPYPFSDGGDPSEQCSIDGCNRRLDHDGCPHRDNADYQAFKH